MSDIPLYYIVLIVFFLFCSAIFSATETAFSCLNHTKLKSMAQDGNKRAKSTLALVDDYGSLLSSVLVGNNIVNVAMASVSTLLFVSILPNAGAAVSTLVITVVVLIFGEISPKSMAKENPEKFAMTMTPVMRVLVFILTPVNFLFSKWQNMLRRVFKLGKDNSMSQDELAMIVEEAAQDGGIDEDESNLLQSAIAFQDQDVEDVLTPRVDMTAINVNDSNGNVAKLFTKCKYSRLPVYEGTIDHIVGILYEKDFYTESGISKIPIKNLMREPVFIPNTMKIDDLLRVLKERKSHIAIVSDEFGGTMGMVTMEDILEELVGEIWDEHDTEDEIYRQIGENAYKILGSADMDQLERILDEKLDSDESTTAGGWVTEQLGRIPQKGDKFTYKNFSVVVTKSSGNRVVEIKVRRDQKPKESDTE